MSRKLNYTADEINIILTNAVLTSDKMNEFTAGTLINGLADVKALGAIGDGQSHPLSDKYGSLAEAKIDFPFATTLNQEIDCCAIQKALNEYDVIFVPVGTYLIDATLTMRVNTILMGAACKATQLKPTSSLNNSYCLQYSDTKVYGGYNGIIANLWIEPVIADNCLGVFLNSGVRFDNVTFYGLKTAVVKADGYLDRFEFKKCSINYCKGDSTNGVYAFDFSKSETDGLVIENMTTITAHGAGEHSEYSGMHISKCRGGSIANSIINTSIKLSNCKAFSIVNTHMEGAQGDYKAAENFINLNHSSVKIDNLYKHKNTTGPDIIMTVNIDGQNSTSLEISNSNFEIPAPYLAAGYYNVVYPEIQKPVKTELKINNCFRTMENSKQWTTTNSKLGIDVELVGGAAQVFKDVSSLASIQSFITINNEILTTYKKSYTKSSTTNVFALNSIAGLDWLKKGDNNVTYFYRLAFIMDKTRKLGGYLSDEVSISGITTTATAGEGGGVMINFKNFKGIDGRGGIVRLYRGKASNAYDEFCDIPTVNASGLYDYGTHLSGYVWEFRTKGVADTFTSIVDYIDATRTTVEFAASEPPTVGTFTKYDKCINPSMVPGKPMCWIFNGTSWVNGSVYQVIDTLNE